MAYADYRDLRFDRHPDGVLLITIDRPDRMNATDERLHYELANVWGDVTRDEDTRVAVVTGSGRAGMASVTADFIDGVEAERIGLVSRCVPPDQVLQTALEIAGRIATGPQQAARWTKRTLNHWLRQAIPAFDASVAYEMLTFMGEDVREGARAIQERRPPDF
jgi:enoyl-CoA hydratase/carnithine racemase